MVATLRDVASAAGVHPATVSRALNPATADLVNAATAQRIRREARRLGYVPNPVARSLKTNRSASVGVLIPDLTNPLFPPIVRGIEDVLADAGYSALIANTDGDTGKELLQASAMRARQVEGLIVATALLHHPLLEQLVAEQVPLVLMNRRVENLQTSTVTGDDASGMSMAVEHLVGLGHRRIAHLAGPQSTSPGIVRLQAFRAALAQHGLPADERLVVQCADFREEDGATALAGMLDAGLEFTAVVAANDLMALGCYDALAARGLRCPDDLSVVGFNDMPFIDKISPPLTTVHVPHYQIGAEAARLLLAKLNGSAADKSVLLPLSLTVRGSTAAPADSRRGRSAGPAAVVRPSGRRRGAGR
ncbi:MAG TPA: LacI family DNA-binding transcriptional regulator [Nakamurella sp.]|nr:LacI family DNA-binding transcriptional regulator [Nakamurella sp.]